MNPGNVRLLDVDGDGDGDGDVNLTDPIRLLLFLFQGGEPPALGTACVSIEGCPDACFAVP